ncbi:MAG: carbamoyltransferase N-terminal domain-containing protein [Acidobacteriota bacterium]
MNIVGISAFYHESACCLLQRGRLVAAAAEERFSRRKHDPRLPVEAFRFCLQQAGLDITEIDLLAYYEQPEEKLGRQLWSGPPAGGSPDLPWLDARAPLRALREELGYDGEIRCYPHHLSHAASAYFFSDFSEAAVLTADGVGEWDTTGYFHGRGGSLETLETVRFPHSLGLLYSAFTSYLGFRVNGGEYKVMGLAPYGQPRFFDSIAQLVRTAPDGRYVIDQRYFDYIDGRRMESPALEALLGQPRRSPESPIEEFHHDVAASIQLLLEEVLVQKVRYLQARTQAQDLCLAGGVALNCVANARIRREGGFQRLFVQPAAGDSGACLGAAALAWAERGERSEALPHIRLGPSFEDGEVAQLVADTLGPEVFEAADYRHRRGELDEALAAALDKGEILGFFQGAMEHGPRALGGRSLLADPRRDEIRDRLNRLVKQREDFRPFAPAVLEEEAAEHFELSGPSPYMLETCAVRSALELPAITHVNGSARPQTVDPQRAPELYRLLRAFQRRTGCPVLLNTSLNVRGEPIVCTPQDALLCFARAGFDGLALGSFLLRRWMLPERWQAMLPAWQPSPQRWRDADSDPLRSNLYTFV